jgi:hypothetical protein
MDLEEFLSRPLFAHLGTVSSDGDPRVSPVWFLWENSAIWILGNHDSDTFPGRVAGHSSCSLAIVDFDQRAGKVHHVGMRGSASVEPFDIPRAKRLLGRYLGQDESRWERARFLDSLHEAGNILVRFAPETVVIRDVSYEPRLTSEEPPMRVAGDVTRVGGTGDL